MYSPNVIVRSISDVLTSFHLHVPCGRNRDKFGNAFSHGLGIGKDHHPMVSYYSVSTRRSRSVSVRRSDEVTETVTHVTPISYYERESRRRNRLLRDELRGAEAGGLLDLAVQRGHSWDTIGIATALHALAMKVKDQSTSSREILRDERWRRLCSLSFSRLVEGEARNLANVAWSLANILERDVPFQNHLAQLATWMSRNLSSDLGYTLLLVSRLQLTGLCVKILVVTIQVA